MTLIIDTATKYLYLALVKNDQVLEEIIQEGQNDHSKTLMPTLVAMLEKHNLKANDLSTIICGVGPGSYTGIRIGVIVAKMLAYNNSNIKLKKVDTLLLMSSGFQGEVASLIDARRGDGFVSLYKIEGNNVETLIDDRFGCKNEFLDEVQIVSQATVNQDGFNPNPLVIINNAVDTTVDDLLPNYLRVTEAERNIGL